MFQNIATSPLSLGFKIISYGKQMKCSLYYTHVKIEKIQTKPLLHFF
jgi:hypothetical protein